MVALHQNEETANIPVIFLTSRKEQETIDRAFKPGAIAYITKPYIWKELLALIKAQIVDT